MNFQIKIVRLNPSGFVRFGSANNLSPEMEALKKLDAWAKKYNIYHNPSQFQGFGFNNPMKPLDNLRGYDVIIMVPDGFNPGENLTVEHYDGGLYAVCRIRGVNNIPVIAREIVKWVNEQEEYECAYPEGYDCLNLPSLELENFLNPPGDNMDDLTIDYYFPIKLKNNE